MRKLKICFAASSGGHLNEVMALKALGDDYDSILITEKTKYKPGAWQKKIYTVPAVNRSNKLICLLKLCIISCIALFVLCKEKPDMLISTGALMTCPVCLLAKIMGKKFVFIESIARIYSGSATGLWAYKRADLFLVQWESLKKIYPKAVYTGRLI